MLSICGIDISSLRLYSLLRHAKLSRRPDEEPSQEARLCRSSCSAKKDTVIDSTETLNLPIFKLVQDLIRKA
jgi:hypothetical protein